MTFMPASPALRMALALSAPGCIQMLLIPDAMASSTIVSVIGGGVIIETDCT